MFETLESAIVMLIMHGYEIQFYGPVNMSERVWMRISQNEEEVLDKLLYGNQMIGEIEKVLAPHIYELQEGDHEVED